MMTDVQRFERRDRREQLQQVGWVRAFRLGRFARLEDDGVKRAIVVALLQDGRHGQLRGVCEQARRPRRVPHAQCRRRRQRRFERTEGLLL